jgi:hypothetical protein
MMISRALNGVMPAKAGMTVAIAGAILHGAQSDDFRGLLDSGYRSP